MGLDSNCSSIIISIVLNAISLAIGNLGGIVSIVISG